MKHRVLILDDEESVHDSFKYIYRKEPITVEYYFTPEEAVKAFKEDPYSYAIAFIDYQYKSAEYGRRLIGHEVAKKLKAINPGLKVIIMSGDESAKAAQDWVQAKADKIMYKPLRGPLIKALISSAIDDFERNFGELTDEEEAHALQTRRMNLKKLNLVGASSNIEKAAKLILKCAKGDDTFLILGETGTGKEVIAEAIHKSSDRSHKKMVTVNCAALPDTLFEGQLFGHTKGSFTGAHQDKKGFIQQSEGSTLFLDDIHQLSMGQQAALLRAIQEKKISRVGGNGELDVDFRLIVAAKPNLLELCDEGKFLPDLYYRIAEALTIDLKPLRERPDDVLPLIKHFQIEMENKGKEHKRFAQDTLDEMRVYSWPGNIRELKSVVKKLYLTVDSKIIKKHHLPTALLQKNKIDQSEVVQIVKMDELDQKQKSERIKLVFKALEVTDDNKTKAAELLGMKRTTFASLLRKSTDTLLGLGASQKCVRTFCSN